MNRIALIYGLIAGGALVVFSTISETIIEPTPENFRTAEVVGYVGILLAMSLIYFAVRRYRDQVVQGALGFGKALGVGLITDFIGSTLYGLFMIYYFKSLSPEFLGQYLEFYRQQIRDSGASAEEIATQLAHMDANVELYTNPYFQALVMFATVFVIGAVISLVSAWLLRRRSADSLQVRAEGA